MLQKVLLCAPLSTINGRPSIFGDIYIFYYYHPFIIFFVSTQLTTIQNRLTCGKSSLDLHVSYFSLCLKFKKASIRGFLNLLNYPVFVFWLHFLSCRHFYLKSDLLPLSWLRSWVACTAARPRETLSNELFDLNDSTKLFYLLKKDEVTSKLLTKFCTPLEMLNYLICLF